MSNILLPAELLLETFSYLDYKTLKSVLKVNKQFYTLLSRDPGTSHTDLNKALFRDCIPATVPENSPRKRCYDLHPFLQAEGFDISGVATDNITGYIPWVTGREVLRDDGKYKIEGSFTQWCVNHGGMKYWEENATSPAIETLEFQIAIPRNGPDYIMTLKISRNKIPVRVMDVMIYRVEMLNKLFKAIERARATGAITLSLDNSTLNRDKFLDTMKWLRGRGEAIPEGLGEVQEAEPQVEAFE